MATIQDEDDEEGSVMLTIVPNEDGEMVAVPVHVGTGDDDHTKMGHVEGVDHGDSQVRNQSSALSYHFSPPRARVDFFMFPILFPSRRELCRNYI